MTATDPARLRAAYRRDGLDRAGMARDPLEQFGRWHEEWARTGTVDAAAAVLATADHRGAPSARCVDLAYVDHGFVFFTNHGSRKGADLAVNPRAELCFGWLELGRQVRVAGEAGRLTDVESDAFYARLPRRVGLLAWASDQGRPQDDRDAIVASVEAAEHRFAGQQLPRPLHWGGYRLIPDHIEFWQQRSDEVHDRFVYRRAAGESSWRLERLAP